MATVNTQTWSVSKFHSASKNHPRFEQVPFTFCFRWPISAMTCFVTLVAKLAVYLKHNDARNTHPLTNSEPPTRTNVQTRWPTVSLLHWLSQENKTQIPPANTKRMSSHKRSISVPDPKGQNTFTGQSDTRYIPRLYRRKGGSGGKNA